MLMTLLPLVGWATDYDVEVRPFDASVDWTGEKPEHVDPSWITCTPSVDATVKAAIANALTIQNLDSYNAGIHTYKLQKSVNSVDVGSDKYNLMVSSSYSAELTINPILTAPTVDASGITNATGLAYTSYPQALLTAGATATTNGVSVDVMYATSSTAETWYSLADFKETNAGSYDVWYKVVGNDNYVGSEPVKFATQTTIAQLNQADAFAVDGAKPTANTWTYDAQAHVLFTAPTAAVAFGTYEYSLTGADETWYTSEQIAASEDLTAAFKGTSNTGNKTVYWRVLATDNYTGFDATALTATIEKATPVITAAPAVTADLTYTGEDQNLLSGPAIVKLGETTLDIQVKYLIKRKKDGLSGTPYSSGISKYAYDAVTGNHASTDYDIQQSTQATDDLNAAATVSTHKAIGLADYPADWYTWQEGKTLRVANAAQELVTPATWNTTTRSTNLQYRVSNNNESSWSEWDAAVPTSNTVGTYIVQCRLVPVPVEGAYDYSRLYKKVTTTIAAKAQVTVTTKANQSFGYGTTPTLEYTATWEEQGTDVLNEAGLAWAWYTNSDCTTPAPVDGNGNYAVGDYYVKAYGATVTGTTAASQEIVYVPALVKITAGQVTAKISATAVYGGLPTYTLTHVSGLSPAEAENFNAANNLGVVTVKKGEEIILNGVANNSNDLKTLPQGTYTLEATASCGANYAVVVSAGTLTVSAKSIADAVITVTTAADDIVYNNKAWGTDNPIAFTVTETSNIEAADYDVAYSNNVNAGTATITLTGKRNYAGTKTQNFTIKKAALTIKADDTTWTYGTTEPTYAVTVTGQAEGETALEVGGTLAGIDGTLTVVRTSNATVGLHADALVAKFGAAQPAASTNYNITYEAGDLTIGKAAATIQLKADVAATLKSEYGVSNAAAKTLIEAKLQNINNYEVKSGISAAELASVNVGSVTCDLADEEYQVTQNYSFTATGATSTNYDVAIDLEGVYFTVTPAPITLYANDQAIDWSDTDPDNDAADTQVKAATVAIAAGELKYTDALTDVVASIVIASQNVGTNNISLTAAENTNYNIFVNSDGTNAKYGVLTVTGAPALALSTADVDLADKLASYNGKAMPVTIDFTARNGRTLGGTRNWEANYWNTLVLPFDITVANLSKALGYAIVNVIDPTRTEVSGTGSKFYGKLTMKGANDKEYIPANTPFMVKTADDITGIVDFGTQTIVAPTNLTVDAGANVEFTGTYTAKSVSKDDDAAIWFLMGNYTNWAFIKSTSTATWNILPFEGFIDMSNLPANAREITFFMEEEDGTVTAIKSVDAEDAESAESAAEGWYTINGIKLNAKPTQKGIYIYNGKKVAIQ